jgi:hypothetical protein
VKLQAAWPAMHSLVFLYWPDGGGLVVHSVFLARPLPEMRGRQVVSSPSLPTALQASAGRAFQNAMLAGRKRQGVSFENAIPHVAEYKH